MGLCVLNSEKEKLNYKLKQKDENFFFKCFYSQKYILKTLLSMATTPGTDLGLKTPMILIMRWKHSTQKLKKICTEEFFFNIFLI